MGSRWVPKARPPVWKRRARIFGLFSFWPRFGLGDEGFVEFDDEFFRVVAKGFSGDGEGDAFIGIDALPGVEVGGLVVGGEGAIEGDVVFDDAEPVELALAKARSFQFQVFRLARFCKTTRQGLVDDLTGLSRTGDFTLISGLVNFFDELFDQICGADSFAGRAVVWNNAVAQYKRGDRANVFGFGRGQSAHQGKSFGP